MNNQLILITNPGSSSRKYALYKGTTPLAALHFEYEAGQIICTISDHKGHKKPLDTGISDLTETVSKIHDILQTEGYITTKNPLAAIAARIVAPGDYFAADHIVDDAFMTKFEEAKMNAPLHAPVIGTELQHFRETFPTTRLLAISDSAFHADRPKLMQYYGIDPTLADQHSIKRYGYHGLSLGYITNKMTRQNILPGKLIIAHLGSGSSVTAIFEGKSMDTSMGYSPLDGLLMSTRSGSIDPAAALALARHENLSSTDLETYLNKKSGLLGVSGETDDMREIIKKRDEGDPRATFAHALYVYKAQSFIGQMAASMNGADALVFTATIGERSADIRHAIAQKLTYLNFHIDPTKNASPDFHSSPHPLISTENSNPIYVIPTNESAEMIRRATLLIKS